jgi:threonine synthase
MPKIAAFAGQPYAQVAAEVLGASPATRSPADVLAMCEEAYATFSHKATCPLVQIGAKPVHAELFHGPSLAFKDVAMQLLGGSTSTLLGRPGPHQTILCATSGDTGGAAVEAFRGRANVRIVALFPEGRISEVQRRFMTTADEANIALRGDPRHVRRLPGDREGRLPATTSLRQAVDLSGVNSINFARIAAQSVYYFTAAVALGAPDRPVLRHVPTGNFGDAFAGYVAKRMGLPIARIVVATNSNDIVARAFETGRYARGAVAHPSRRPWTSSRVQLRAPLFRDAVRREGVETARAFTAFATPALIDIPPQALTAMREPSPAPRSTRTRPAAPSCPRSTRPAS